MCTQPSLREANQDGKVDTISDFLVSLGPSPAVVATLRHFPYLRGRYIPCKPESIAAFSPEHIQYRVFPVSCPGVSTKMFTSRSRSLQPIWA